MNDLRLLKVISLLLDYPTTALFSDQGVKEGDLTGNVLEDCRHIVNTCIFISPQIRLQISGLITYLQNQGELLAQAYYDGLFERGRSLSLWLFEHVHGESRDRGQAMVDLMAQYENAGFLIDAKELPDYLPMYLEFLSYKATTNDLRHIRQDLTDISHIVALIGARLKQKNSPYAALFYALLQLAGQPLSLIDDALVSQKGTQADDTPAMLDAQWQEEAVDFLSAQQQDRCPSNQVQQYIAQKRQNQAIQAAPVHWVDFNQGKKDKTGAKL